MAKSNKGRKLFATTATAALVASAIVPVASAAQVNDFNSVSSYAKEAVQDLVDRGVITGDEKGNFQPTKTVTRAEAAKIMTEALGLEATGSIDFTDVKASAWYYDAIVAAVSNGVFEGQGAGKFNPSGNLTRSEAAKILVEAFDLEGTASLSDFKDAGSVKAWAKESLEIAVANGVLKGDNGNLKPNAAITKQEFAVMFYRTENLDKEVATPDAAVPTKIELAEKTTQSAFGEKVTVTAKVTVAEGQSLANIPVTFAVDPGADTLLQPQLKEEVKTNAEGVATFTYTRQHKYSTSTALTDDVTAYPTAKPSLKANGIVYWGQALTIKDVTTETTLANNASKTYQITGTPGATYAVTFAENLGVTPDKAVKGAKFVGIGNYLLTSSDTAFGVVAPTAYPYEYTTGGVAVSKITLDKSGKANLVVTGTEATVTPIVYAQYKDKWTYNERALQTKASTVTFKQNQVLDLTLKAEGQQVAANRIDGTNQIGGRDYVATLTTKDGKPAVGSQVYVAIKKETGSKFETVKLYKADGATEIVSTTSDAAYVYYPVTTNAKGQATFTVTNSAVDAYVTPIVFLDNGTAVPNRALDTTDQQATADITYFTAMTYAGYTSAGSVTDAAGEEATSFGVSQSATFTYQLSDQNGKPRAYDKVTTVTFAVTVTGANPVNVKGVTYQPGQTAWVTEYLNAYTTTDVAVVVTGTGKPSAVTVVATPTNDGLALGQYIASATFTTGAATASYEVAQATANATSLDVATITFSEAVTTSNISVLSTGTVASVAANASNNKVLHVTFSPALAIGSTFTVTYNGKPTVFVYRGNGIIEKN